MANPVIVVKKEPFDNAVERAGWLALALLIFIPAWYFGDLPDEVPRHFGPDGSPTAWSGKGFIWIMPIIGSIMFVKLFFLSRYPHIYNYPVTVTEENAPRLYLKGSRMIRVLNAVLVYVFLYITYSSIQTALGEQSGLNPAIMFAMMGTIFAIIGFYLIDSYRNK
ncbi:MAG: protein of unknown function DUF1648 [Bacteroidetes bacterium HLUCCA01]|nr:MAG: protein of unknown function DUF1648 [Bacteroidetes bacterium HLUCCA01]